MKLFKERFQKSSTNEIRARPISVPNCGEQAISGRHRARLLTTNEAHYFATSSGAIYSSGPAKYSFWSRYLDVFDEVVVLARVSPGHQPKSDQQRADGPGVYFRALPDHTGPWGYLRVRSQLRMITRQAIAECDAYFLRVPGLISQMVWSEIVRSNKTYALEVVGDPWDALGPGSGPSVLRPVLRRVATQQMKRICAGATAVCYVTATALQRRYPPSKKAFTANFSEALIEINRAPDNICADRNRRLRAMPWMNPKTGSSFVVGFVGTFSQLYKGPDVLLRALSHCRPHLNFQLRMVGEGRHLDAMKVLAAKLGLGDRVQFLGQLPFGNSVSDFLDSIDLFVLPSRAEGLSHALLEAMSRGCPCIASTVGGIPDVLEAGDLVPAGNPTELAKLILQVAADRDRLLAMSARNLIKAAQFTRAKLDEARRTFLEAVKQRSLPK